MYYEARRVTDPNCRFIFSSRDVYFIGQVVRYKNIQYVLVKAYSYANDCPNLLLIKESSIEKTDKHLRVVGVQYESSQKIYHYWTYRKWIPNTEIFINDSRATIIRDGLIPSENGRATKILEEEATHQFFRCRFINKDGAHSNTVYQYYTDISIEIKKDQFFVTDTNQTIQICDFSDCYPIKKNTYKKLLFQHYDKLDDVVDSFNKLSFSVGNATNAIQKISYGQPINNKNEKENTTMNFMKNLEFGKINTREIKMSMCGIAFRRADNTYATYDAKSNSFTDVSDFLIDFDCVYVMPVAAKDLKEGDIVKHLNTYVVIKSINEDNTISAISPIKAEEICIIPTKNMFGFNYCSKVMNLFEGINTPDAENPFGNPLMLMMLSGNSMENKGDFNSLIPLLLLGNQNGEMKDIMNNPLFLLSMMKN